MFMYIEIYIFFFFNSLFLHGLIFIHIFYTVDNVYYFFYKTEFTFIATIVHLMFNVIDLIIYMLCGNHGGWA